MILFLLCAMLLLYPLFLDILDIRTLQDVRVITYFLPYAMGALGLTIILSGLIDLFRRKEDSGAK
ncbi:hypothetical protein [Paenibacillus mucilaginosus]|uniref:Uncharacterized protein n=3 Tax=Paenibacillus mucilaginosus TaxID=61624 RepID=H6NK87_9BACL|nr:hypothetical protein [Paenibacillus mucilaginosus]AEI43990.1 hypothetical protein KNP414_05466 [Paenibacillus mucilaginosus KNP414]AFC31571.1 hypothetical protein PM3016_4835 [Paenibacillus mucilaginosus 3016]AFH63916.1 hypothetical protein B2K_25060 [Paenibacillus mucilaginosus K02]MCG7212519.1 hypothetical protein [Paenibacillus mucilaginosus]WDM25450.1 hypothetical protein KCX80_23705 [Paenibacillus mucilaginosus]